MFMTFYDGKKGQGFSYKGEINGVSVISIRPDDRSRWIQIVESKEGVTINEYPNHEFKDSGDLSHIKTELK